MTEDKGFTDPNEALMQCMNAALESKNSPGYRDEQLTEIAGLMTAGLKRLTEEDWQELAGKTREHLLFSVSLECEQSEMGSWAKAAEAYTKFVQNRNMDLVIEYSNRIGSNLYFEIKKNRKEGIRTPSNSRCGIPEGTEPCGGGRSGGK